MLAALNRSGLVALKPVSAIAKTRKPQRNTCAMSQQSKYEIAVKGNPDTQILADCEYLRLVNWSGYMTWAIPGYCASVGSLIRAIRSFFSFFCEVKMLQAPFATAPCSPLRKRKCHIPRPWLISIISLSGFLRCESFFCWLEAECCCRYPLSAITNRRWILKALYQS